MEALAVRVTPEANHHFFGYYDRCPWDSGNRFLLSLETDFMDREPRSEDRAQIGVVDFDNGRAFRRVAQTYAWNFQEGAKLQWLNNRDEPVFIHNDRREGRFVSVIRNLEGKELRVLLHPVYHVAEDGRKALSLNFSRVARTVPGYGYVGVPDESRKDLAPANDGIRLVSLETGDDELIVPLAEIAKHQPCESMRNAQHWVMHLLFNPSGSRFVFIHRWGPPMRSAVWESLNKAKRRKSWFLQTARSTARAVFGRMIRTCFVGYQSRLFTANIDGTDIRCLADHKKVSHYFWRDDDHLLCWARREPVGERYWLFNVCTGDAEPVGERVFDRDGHCSYQRDGRWIVTDTYPDESGEQTLIIFNVEKQKRIDLGRYFTQPEISNTHFRCDLHPRFDREGTRVCFDSTHEGHRQIYVVDASEVMKCS